MDGILKVIDMLGGTVARLQAENAMLTEQNAMLTEQLAAAMTQIYERNQADAAASPTSKDGD